MTRIIGYDTGYYQVLIEMARKRFDLAKGSVYFKKMPYKK